LSFFPDECFQEFILQDLAIVRLVYGKSVGWMESRRRMALVPKEHIERLVTQLDPTDLQYFPEKRIPDLPFEGIQGRQIAEIFRQADSKEERQRKLALIPRNALSSLVSKLPKIYLGEFSNEEIRDLHYPNITDIHQIAALLLSGTKDEIKRRVSLLSKETIEHLLPRFKSLVPSTFDGSFLQYVTKEQLKSMNVELFSHLDAAFLFPSVKPEGVHPLASHSVAIDWKGQPRHVFQWPQGLTHRSYTEEEMANILKEKMSMCLQNREIFEGKLHLMRLNAETRQWIETFRGQLP
jgi:hypothetical protein